MRSARAFPSTCRWLLWDWRTMGTGAVFVIKDEIVIKDKMEMTL
jgi:hypothetical protein